ncbi:IS30 family transposase [Gallaecimonas pentaromativorans]|uniref:IS30 family transposase n=1 Tax=Gallaecimonas pentaromativorans TaxID=584787 RepID=A0A3N1NQD2_9GAMM|nr:IS30 family transposase [Gallaecimonas pentaromativorans]ROQ21974.1 IS30 family transposase [Gallaecimonas pentaromativorans]
MSYQQLTEGKRYQIAALIAQGCSRADVAKAIGVHRTTLYRELKRNSLDGVYQPQQAHAATSTRRAQARKYRVPTQTLEYVELTLSWQWSPEQISQLSHRISRPVSHEWIYRHVAADKARGGKLYKALRQGHKRYRKGRHPKRAVIAERRSIEECPAIVDSRERFGDWEVDTVLGKQGSGALVTLAERKSRFYLVRKVKTKEASEVSEAIIDMLKPYQAHVHTITADNGSEFVEHKAIAKALAADFYFAHPYSPWERGLNENFNGLLRQYIPKGTDLCTVSTEDVRMAQQRLNLQPRKCLGFRQPALVFQEYLQAA